MWQAKIYKSIVTYQVWQVESEKWGMSRVTFQKCHNKTGKSRIQDLQDAQGRLETQFVRKEENLKE